MANEIKVHASIQINHDNLKYPPTGPTSFSADQDLALGPTPGLVLASVAGTVIDLSALTTPGVCEITNLDETNYIQFGVTDGTYFYPLGEVLPGEKWPMRLYRSLGSREATPGTGSSNILDFMIRADTAACYCVVSAFNK